MLRRINRPLSSVKFHRNLCDATYGLSIGRGSFHFAPGDWTHVTLTVRLNTPGKQDGGFVPVHVGMGCGSERDKKAYVPMNNYG